MRALTTSACLALLLSLLAGCAIAPPQLLTPVAPAALGESVEVRQQVTATVKGRTRVMQVALKVAPSDLTMIGLSSIGQRLFTLSWNEGETTLTSSLGDVSRLDPTRILADLELAYWPLPALRAALEPDLRLEQQGTVRTLWRNDELLWFASSDTGDRWTSALTIYNASAGYRLDIRPLSAPAVTP